MRVFLDNKTKKELMQVKQIADKVEGWLSDDEGAFLFLRAKSGAGSGAIVEIGSWKGKSTIWLAKGSKSVRREKVYAIDPHISDEYGKEKTFLAFKRNLKLASVDDYVIPIVAKSEDAAKKWNKPIRLLWIDGSHKYEEAKKDFLLWERFLVEGGIIALHDTVTKEGPKRVSLEMIKSGKFSDIGFVDDITFARKNAHASRWQNAFMLISRKIALLLLWIRLPAFRNLVKKIFFKQYM